YTFTGGRWLGPSQFSGGAYTDQFGAPAALLSIPGAAPSALVEIEAEWDATSQVHWSTDGGRTWSWRGMIMSARNGYQWDDGNIVGLAMPGSSWVFESFNLVANALSTKVTTPPLTGGTPTLLVAGPHDLVITSESGLNNANVAVYESHDDGVTWTTDD